MEIFCKNCNTDRKFKSFIFHSKYFFELAMTWPHAGRPISYHQLCSFLGIRKIAKSFECLTCNSIITICPYCANHNLSIDTKNPKCEKCNKKFYLY